jgi:hypothetical protein
LPRHSAQPPALVFSQAKTFAQTVARLSQLELILGDLKRRNNANDHVI